MDSDDVFSDADLYWNAKIPSEGQPYFFAREDGILQREPYVSSLESIGIEIDENDFMANTSFISLSGLKNRVKFAELSNAFYEKITREISGSLIENHSQKKILRLSEQIALSLTISKLEQGMKPLKRMDHPMDNGHAESYYLGTTKGWS